MLQVFRENPKFVFDVVGIPAKACRRAFDAFFSTKRSGSGLGLATTRKIIEGHGGSITLQSEPGRGTQFTIALPVPRRLPRWSRLRQE